MFRILLFAGTTEGRKLTEYFSGQSVFFHVCTATEYGETLIEKDHNILTEAGRLDKDAMKVKMTEHPFDAVIDATHPYAAEVSANIRQACEETAVKYIRLIRKAADTGSSSAAVYVDSVPAAAEYLAGKTGKIFVSTGSKELEPFVKLADYKERLVVRVLSAGYAVEKCLQLGLEGKNLICMQGPFSEELNYQMFKDSKADWLVTKESGAAGGFAEKIRAAERAGVKTVIVGRPVDEKGYVFEEVREWICRQAGIDKEREIIIAGIGMGDSGSMTEEVRRAVDEADLLIGARRMLDCTAKTDQEMFCAWQPDVICDHLEQHKEYSKVVILFSGDSGFYSGAGKLTAALTERNIKARVLPGISSAAYLAARLKMSWEDAAFFSIHGREMSAAQLLRRYRKVFLLAGTQESLTRLIAELSEYGMGETRLVIGEHLGSDSELITEGTPESLAAYLTEGLAVLYLEYKREIPSVVVHGIPDERFIRGRIPMTKQEVRAVSLSKLQLTEKALMWDVGAGTGSVAAEAALQACQGRVYAIEKKPEALELIAQNARKLGAANLIPVAGTAPAALADLPAPTHVFLGGSSGAAGQILACAVEANPDVRIVMNIISLRTFRQVQEWLDDYPDYKAEVVQMQVSRREERTGYEMMRGENPIYIITVQRKPI